MSELPIARLFYIDPFGKLVNYESAAVKVIYDRLGPGWVEIDIDHIWKSICETTWKIVSTNLVEDGQDCLHLLDDFEAIHIAN